MTGEEQIAFLKQLRKRFGDKRGSFENKNEFVKFMNDCGKEEKEICVKYMEQYSNKMFTGGVCK